MYLTEKRISMNKNRPVNLDLKTIKFPPTAIASILHRIAGVVIFLLLPFILCELECSLQPHPTHFYSMNQSFFSTLLLFGFFSAFTYHLLAGIRHLLMDMGFGDTYEKGKITAYIVIILSLIISIFIGLSLWQIM
jgi:succinate dehydrogenase / fumarate reductase cytochrome b subunit